MIPTAQVPESVVTKTADSFLQQGILGAVVIVLLAAVVWGARWLKGCLESSAERTGAGAAMVEQNKAAMDRMTEAMKDVARRLEALERKP